MLTEPWPSSPFWVRYTFPSSLTVLIGTYAPSEKAAIDTAAIVVKMALKTRRE